MIGAIQSALTGLTNAQNKVQGAANNIATKVPDPTLTSDVVDIQTSKNTFAANAKVIQAESDMQKDLMKLFDKTV